MKKTTVEERLESMLAEAFDNFLKVYDIGNSDMKTENWRVWKEEQREILERYSRGLRFT